MKDRLDQLLELIEAEPEGLQTVDFLQAQAALASLLGKTVTAAAVEETRVAITAADGSRYYFYGFLGSEKPN
jgi:hypothetical protein